MRDAVVLVVDDGEANVLLLQRLLAKAGMREVIGVTDPRLAIATYEQLQPDLVLLDLHMPHLDGIAVLEALRAVVPPTSFTPILVLTADTTLEAKQQALALGAHDFVNKPFEQSELLLRVRNLLTTRALHQQLESHNAKLEREIRAHAEREAAAAEADAERRARVHRVLGGSGLEMVFQPIVDLRSREVIGLEALARFGALPYRSPDQWFEEAAAVGLGIELELHAVRRAAAELHLLPPDLYLSVNVSPESAVHPDLADILAVAPHRFVVEVTEHAQVDDYDTLLDGLGRLRDRGVRLAIDDAGAGYSSLRHILRLQPDVIKLDIDLTRNIDIDPARRALAAAFVRFAEEIGSTITAEGVETEAELATLQDLQVGRGQGYLFGRPGPLRAAVRHDVGVGP